MNENDNNIEDFLIDKKIEEFNISEEHKSIAKKLYKIDPEKSLELFNNLKKFPFTMKAKRFDLKKIENLNEEEMLKELKIINNIFSKIEILNKKEDNILLKKIKELDLPIDYFLALVENKKINKNLIKEKKLDFNDQTKELHFILNNDNNSLFADFKYNIELQNDYIAKEIIYSNANKLKRSIISNKYKKIINQETEDIFIECAKQNISKEFLMKNVAPKIAALESAKDFNELLENALGFNSEWTLEAFKEKIKNRNVDIVREQDNSISIEINNFEDSQFFGSRMWCITREESYLNDYLYRDSSRIIFKFNFNENIKSKKAYSALLYTGDNLFDVYDKNDFNLKRDEQPFLDLKNEKIKKESSISMDRKHSILKNLIRNKEIEEINSVTYLNLVRLDLNDEIKNIDEDFLDIGQSSNNIPLLKNFINDFDINKTKNLLKSKHISKISSYLESSELTIINQAINKYDDKDDFDFFYGHKKIKELKKKIKSINDKYLEEDISVKKKVNILSDLTCFLECKNKNREQLFKYLEDENIKYSDLFAKHGRLDIDREQIEYIESKEPNFIYNSLEKNPRGTIVYLLKNKNLDIEKTKQVVKEMEKNEKSKNYLLKIKERFNKGEIPEEDFPSFHKILSEKNNKRKIKLK